ncbi:YqiA/YcfP family alpha/beta fold hydrolase [Oceanospirillum maris]|uniref:YqiA/YcfP family alpha/beta fold hydrolase n=1 Tax=Oceanospirillum maris TaxID=64977 RepID=UPI00041215C0|nr:YqiA/YcfP family alpha/beta fold hydrolase [Oceanospirillum maris]
MDNSIQHHVIYIHGFNSSPGSFKALQLKAFVEQNKLDLQYHAPMLSHWPEQAMETLEDLLESIKACDQHTGKITRILLVGSSLGGFYSTYLMARYPGLKAVLINPAVYPQELLPAYLGLNENLYTGEQYQLTQDHMQQLRRLHMAEPACTQNIKVLLQSDDEVLDYHRAENYYRQAEVVVIEGGDHGFQNFEQYFTMMLDFAGIDYPEQLAMPEENYVLSLRALV